MEVSSHALHQGRINGIDFDGAVFTNLSQDHLDYHQTMEEYFEAKSILFEKLTSESFAVINIDDPYGSRFIKKTKARVISYGYSKEAMIRADQVRLESTKSLFEIVFPQGKITLQMRLLGRFNVSNVLAAFSVAWTLGVNPQKIKASLESFWGVPGRMEFVPVDAPFQVIVDYAHTDDALQNVLNTLRSLITGRLITVFGCGGDRDRSKRSKMGEVSGCFSDLVIITTDNPRSEDPAHIASQIEEGVRRTSTPFHKLIDRKSAIEFALKQARPGDLILIAGKGHEKFQEIGLSRVAFDDVSIARELCHSLMMKCEVRST
jgi:UDP-N-acetylmuramoyl-L-alanyl-D-glutamate--2,6-diaminopimelate ligase